MLTLRQEDLLGKTIAFAGFAVTVLIFNGIAYDPVNLPKMTILAVFAGAIFGIYFLNLKTIWQLRSKLLGIYLFLFLGIIASTILSRNPFELNFYGTAGRNTGMLTYICLTLISLGSMLLNTEKSFKRIIFAVLAAGYLNVIYCSLVQFSGKDPFPWTNPYGTFLGTFGNPNFISSYLGIFTSVSMMYFYNSSQKTWMKLLVFASLPLNLYLIFKTNSIQGLVVLGIGTLLFLFRIVREKFGSVSQIAFSMTSVVIGVISILGMLQFGPMTKYLYKTSVSLRGEYWNAGLNMFKDSPIWGIGLDSYGTHYREQRRESALLLPGTDVVTDSAHNVFIDILAGGGLILFIPYVFLHLSALVLSVKHIRHHRKLDNIFSSLFAGWITYLAQSVISINQIGLAIWGWIIPGALMGYLLSKNSHQHEISNRLSKQKNTLKELSPSNFLSTVSFTLMFTLMIAPMVMAETSWKNSIRKDKVDKIIASTDKWPRSNSRYVQTIGLFLRSNMPNEALEVSKKAVEFNVNSFDGWFYILNISQDEATRANAKLNLRRIDPLNPKYKV
jgi:O-antigen ligase